jgi:hypothetical protein
MAQMIPDAVPPGRPMSERRVFSTLQGLPDDCWVYYEPLVTNRYPDFVVFMPDRGLLVIEVKGWHPGTVLGGDSHTIRLRDGTAPNPIRQARDYMTTLMDGCRRHRLHEVLVHSSGANAGKFRFPFGYLALLSEITDDQLRRHSSGDLRRILPSSHVVAADDFDRWAVLNGSALKDRLGSFFDPAWPFKLSKEQVDAVRSVLHPEIILPLTPDQIAVRAGDQLLLPDQQGESSAQELKTMDLQQERLARKIGAGHRLLFGVAGSGKTVVLIARAKLLSEALPNGKILVLSFNVPFNRYLAKALEGRANIQVSTFHGWGAKNGVSWNGEPPDAYGRRLLDALEDGRGRDAEAFDAVLIDEAQDFDPSWYRCVTRAMKEPRNGDLLIVGDGNQTTYRLGRISWKSLGIDATRGRATISKHNYRNTRPIQAAAVSFSENSGTSDEIAATACEPTSAWRDSPIAPVLFGRASRGEELDAIQAIVHGMLEGRFPGNDCPALQPSEIGVLYRRNPGGGLLESLRDRLASMAPIIWLNEKGQGGDSRQRVLEPGIKLQTIHSAKGLQYRAVVLIFADLLGTGETDTLEEERRLLYVALTRPEEVLVVSCTTREGQPIPPILRELLSCGAFRQG